MMIRKTPPVRVVKAMFLILLPFAAIVIFVKIVGEETLSALRRIYLEIRVEIESAREQWRSLPNHDYGSKGEG